MRIYCTYCSKDKDPREGLLPAIERYRSTRIAHVRECARQEGVEMWILSGEFGLIPSAHPIPWYDHLLMPDEVTALADRMSQQLDAAGIHHVVFFQALPSTDSHLGPYRLAIETACAAANVQLEVRMYSGGSDWENIMRRAEQARRIMIVDRERGEDEFAQLLSVDPTDGMIYFKRAEAYEALKVYDLAAKDYALAESLFPMASWKAQARVGLRRVRQEIPEGDVLQPYRTRLAQIADVVPYLAEPVQRAMDTLERDPSSAAVSLRQALERALDALVDRAPNGPHPSTAEDIAVVSGTAPEMVVSHMHTVRKIGNMAAHGTDLAATDVLSSLNSMLCILEWMSSRFSGSESAS